METEVSPIPEGYHSVTPYLVVQDGPKAIEFYKKVFQAKEIFRMETPAGKIGHCELEIGDSRIMLADENPERGYKAPSEGERGFSIMLYVENVDEVFDLAVDNGATIIHPLKDQFYGDRMGTVKDPFGQIWNLGSQVEKLSPEEIKKRAEKVYGSGAH